MRVVEGLWAPFGSRTRQDQEVTCGARARGAIMSVAVIGAKLGSYLPFLILAISIVIGVPAAYRYYRQVREDDDPIRDADLLADLEQGDAASLMTEAEFRRVPRGPAQRPHKAAGREAARQTGAAQARSAGGRSRSGRVPAKRRPAAQRGRPAGPRQNRRRTRLGRVKTTIAEVAGDQGLVFPLCSAFRTSAAGARPSARD